MFAIGTFEDRIWSCLIVAFRRRAFAVGLPESELRPQRPRSASHASLNALVAAGRGGDCWAAVSVRSLVSLCMPRSMLNASAFRFDAREIQLLHHIALGVGVQQPAASALTVRS